MVELTVLDQDVGARRGLTRTAPLLAAGNLDAVAACFGDPQAWESRFRAAFQARFPPAWLTGCSSSSRTAAME